MQTTKKKINRRSAIKLAKQFVGKCNERGLEIKKAMLFGSYVTGIPDNNSDIDLLLVSDKFSNNTLDNWKLLAPITAKLYDIEPHPYPVKRFLKGDPFVEVVKQTGIEIRVDS
jgi:predicted nucleotidyltransferase